MPRLYEAPLFDPYRPSARMLFPAAVMTGFVEPPQQPPNGNNSGGDELPPSDDGGTELPLTPAAAANSTPGPRLDDDIRRIYQAQNAALNGLLTTYRQYGAALDALVAAHWHRQ